MVLEMRAGSLTEPLSGRHWSRQDVLRRVERQTAWFRREGMGPGDRVFLHYGNRLEFFTDLLAIWRLGACAVPIDTRLTPFEVEQLALATTPAFSLWREGPAIPLSGRLPEGRTKVLELDGDEDGPAGDAASLPSPLPVLDQEALILFTSGTTGRPKGVVHTHRSLRARWMALRQQLGLAAFRRTLCLLPTHFGHGLICNSLFPWLSGQDLYITPPFEPGLLMRLGSLVDEHRITFLSSVPSVWRVVLKLAPPPRAGTLERVFCGSAPLSAALWKEIQRWSGAREVFNAYGITETGSWVAGTTVHGFEPEDGLIGEAWGAVVHVGPEAGTDEPLGRQEPAAPGTAGYVWLNTPALMKGYFDRDDLTRAVTHQGWFFTGDVGYVDDRGWLYLRGRVREEINKGGMKVYPGDVDAVLERFEGIDEVCCFGYDDDPLYGQNIGVALVLAEGRREALPELYAWARRHLAAHQMPVRWYLVDALPRTDRGKVNRAQVAEACAGLVPLALPSLRPVRASTDR